MNELILKYNQLDSVMQHQVMQFIDYLIATGHLIKNTSLADYKKKILNVSTWQDTDIQEFDNNNKFWQKCNIQEW